VTPHDESRNSFQDSLGERLIGLGMILGGLLGFGLVYLMWRFAPAAMPVPAGLPRDLLPIASPLNCVLPIVAIGSSLLVMLGLKRLVVGE
jgi:hypothetical protein